MHVLRLSTLLSRLINVTDAEEKQVSLSQGFHRFSVTNFPSVFHLHIGPHEEPSDGRTREV
jgi:hypothetical protein